MSSFQEYYCNEILYSQANTAYESVPMTESQSDEARQLYLEAVECTEQTKNHEDMSVQTSGWEQTWNMFQKVISEIEARLDKPEKGSEESITIRIGTENYCFASDQIVTIGSYPHCNIQCRDPGVSRVHIVLKKMGTKWILFDLGSYKGIEITARTDASAPLAFSTPHHRKPLVIDETETVSLKMGYTTVIINPKECLLMLTESCTTTRDFIGQCGHFICCTACAMHWKSQNDTCPQCRAPFFGPNSSAATNYVHTMTREVP
jgi:FHA domain/Zinc finger, C3HC4 type (RING finger)